MMLPKPIGIPPPAMKTYRYRKHILWMKYLLPAALLLAAIGLVAPLIASGRGSIGVSAGLAVVLALEAWVIWWFFGRLARVGVGLTECGIVYHGKKGSIDMTFDEITEIKQPSIRYTGGWLKVQSAAETIRLTVVLEGIGEFVGELKESLDRLQLSDKYDRAKLFRFYKTATYADQSWARLYQHFFKFLLLLLAGVAIGTVVATFQVQKRSSELLWILSPTAFGLLPLAVIVIAEVIIGRHFAKATNEVEFTVPGRDRAFESKVFKRTLWIGGLLVIATGVAVLVIGSI